METATNPGTVSVSVGVGVGHVKVRNRPEWTRLRRYLSGHTPAASDLRVGRRTIEWMGAHYPPGSPVPSSMPPKRLRQFYEAGFLEATDAVLNTYRPGRHVPATHTIPALPVPVVRLVPVPVAPQRVGAELQAETVLPAAAAPLPGPEPFPFAFDPPPVPVTEEFVKPKSVIPARPFSGKPSVR